MHQEVADGDRTLGDAYAATLTPEELRAAGDVAGTLFKNLDVTSAMFKGLDTSAMFKNVDISSLMFEGLQTSTLLNSSDVASVFGESFGASGLADLPLVDEFLSDVEEHGGIGDTSSDVAGRRPLTFEQRQVLWIVATWLGLYYTYVRITNHESRAGGSPRRLPSRFRPDRSCGKGHRASFQGIGRCAS